MAGPDFPRAEYEARLETIQTAMQGAGLDAVFFTSEAEMRYFTGFRTLFWQSPTRPWFLVVPRSGMPLAIIPEIGAELMGSASVGEIRTWASPHPYDDGLSLLADALRPYARIGMMLGRETALRMPLADYERLRADLTGCEFADATAMVQRQRMLKSEAEIALIGEICSIASTSFEAAPDLFRQGQTFSEAFRAFKIELLKNGAEDVPYLVGGAGQGGYGDVISPPGEDRLEAGDVLMLDTGATLRGYFCDFDRNFAIGSPTPAVKSAHAKLVDAVDAASDLARPGGTASQLFHEMDRVLTSGKGTSAGRLGHGLGMQLTEGLSLIPDDHTELMPGMVLALEPGIEVSPGQFMVHEENVVIRRTGAEFLTPRASRDIVALEA